MIVSRTARLGALLAAVLSMGCSRYPPVSSPESLHLVRALYTACNTQDPARLAKFEKALAQAVAAGKVTPAELQVFQAIVAEAKQGNWKEAEQSAYRFAQDQVR